MRLRDFEQLSTEKQADIIYKVGVYIGKSTKTGIRTILYQVDSFYTEVFYNKYRSEIYCIHCFASTEFLDPYLEKINVDHLVNPL